VRFVSVVITTPYPRNLFRIVLKASMITPRFALVLFALVASATAFAPIPSQGRVWTDASTRMGFFGGGKKNDAGADGGGASSPAAVAKRVASEIGRGVTVYTTSRDGASKKAKQALDALGATYKEVALDKDPDGPAIKAELKKKTGKTSVPLIFIKGQFIGTMTEGGPSGKGLSGLDKAGMLGPMLKNAGAAKASAVDRTPLAPLFGNNLRDALGNLPGQTGKMR